MFTWENIHYICPTHWKIIFQYHCWCRNIDNFPFCFTPPHILCWINTNPIGTKSYFTIAFPSNKNQQYYTLHAHLCWLISWSITDSPQLCLCYLCQSKMPLLHSSSRSNIEVEKLSRNRWRVPYSGKWSIRERKFPSPTLNISLYSVFCPLLPWQTSKSSKYPDG